MIFNRIKIFFVYTLLCLFIHKARAQLGFCSGNSGDSIFSEDFGTGFTNNPLPAGTTTYPYATGYPGDGFYTVSNGTFGNGFDWHQIPDHTTGDLNGKCLIVNASFSPGEIYRTIVSGLCETTTYEFSGWLINLVIPGSFCSMQPGGTIPINVSFEIWDNTDTNLLASGSTGNIIESIPNWQEYGLVFQTLAGQNAVILKIINNGQGGCGNDLAIDDLEFKTCGDSVIVEDTLNSDSINLCSSETPFSVILTATPDFSVFSSHFYQWQESLDGITWTDILGETNQNISISITSSMFYRTKVAEVAINLSNSQCILYSEIYQATVNQAPTMPTIECWETATINNATCLWEVTGTQPVAPTNLECWETTTFNNTTCLWEVTGIQPATPTNLKCWETAIFNDSTCLWEVTGTQPVAPTNLECWETTTFNNTTCLWEVTGIQPATPTNLECWETAIFNDSTCLWEVTGTQPVAPTNLECWETTTFNNTTCLWEVTGTQPVAPTNLECWETTTFNNTTCLWEVTGTQPVAPTNLECWETAIFNDSTCLWEVTGTQPVAPTNLECWETTTFNNTTCLWEVTGTQPVAPTNLECWETTTFNNTTCLWEVTGIQPATPTNLECWETAIFNDSTCLWEVTGTQPVAPTNLECWETAIFNDSMCLWEVTGTQPVAPTNLECWETTTFNNTTCLWEVTGTQPVAPTNLECWETATFNDTTCLWEVTGTQPVAPTNLECWETTAFNNITCEWEINGVQPAEPTVTCNEFTTFNNVTCVWEVTEITIDPILETLFFCENGNIDLSADIDNASYVWNTGDITKEINVDEIGTYSVEITDVLGCIASKKITVNMYDQPEIESVISNGNSIIVNTVSNGDYEYSLNGNIYQPSNTFQGVEGGYYTIYVRNLYDCPIITRMHLHFIIPKFMTPNGDSYHDTFDLSGIEFFQTSEVYIFDRFGKLLKSSKNNRFAWDGTFNNQLLPSSDYWYIIKIEGQEFRGHFTLKR